MLVSMTKKGPWCKVIVGRQRQNFTVELFRQLSNKQQALILLLKTVGHFFFMWSWFCKRFYVAWPTCFFFFFALLYKRDLIYKDPPPHAGRVGTTSVNPTLIRSTTTTTTPDEQRVGTLCFALEGTVSRRPWFSFFHKGLYFNHILCLFYSTCFFFFFLSFLAAAPVAAVLPFSCLVLS